MRSWPPASTATVPVGRLARCAAASMPRASPEAIAKPASPSSRASRSANFCPAADALREPTIATIGREKHRKIAAQRDEGRRIVDRGKPLRIGGFADRDEFHAQIACRLELAFGVGARTDPNARSAAAARELRQAPRAPRGRRR